MSQHVDKVSVSVTGLDGVSVNVQSFELTAAINAIPSIVVELLPVDLGANAKGASASTPDFDAVTELFNKLLKMAAGLSSKATIDITVESAGSLGKNASGGENRTDSVTLKDWILADVGLSSVTSYAAPTLTAIFMHPALMLDHSGVVYETVKTPSALKIFYRNVSGGNVIELMDEVYGAFSTPSNGILYYDTPSVIHGGPDSRSRAIVQKSRQLIGDNLPGKYLEDNTPGLFLQNVPESSEIMPYIKAAIADTASPAQPWDVTTWRRLVTKICPALMLHVVPTYDKEKLRIEPINPWQNVTRSLDSCNIEAVDLASLDKDPVYGVGIEKYPGNLPMVTGINTRTPTPDVNSPEYCRHAFYFPPKVSESTVTDTYGRIEYIGDNPILTAAKSLDLGSFSVGDNVVKMKGKYTDKKEAQLNAVVAEAMFNLLYRRSSNAGITSVLAFKDANGKMIYPGRVIGAKGLTTKSVFYGHLVRMTLRGSSNGTSSSYYELSHARPEHDENILIDEGTDNPCYGPTTYD